MSFEFGDSFGEHRYVVLLLELRELFLELSNLFLEHVSLLVLLFWVRYFSSPALFRVLSR